MKFKEHLKLLNDIAEKNPECLEYEAYTSRDDESNAYHQVVFEPELYEIDNDNHEIVYVGEDISLNYNSIVTN